MFDKLIDLLVQWWEMLNPFFIIRDYQEGVLLRFGKYKKNLLPGVHLKIPFVDEVMEQHTVVTTLSLPSQSLYTSDKVNLVAKGVIKYKISDIKTFLLEVFDAKDALSDMTQSIIKEIVMDKSLNECINSELDAILTKKVRVEARRWGVEIQKVTLTDLAPIRSFRLINDTFTNVFD